MAAQYLVRPAAAEVRSMLQRIKMENLERVSSSVYGGIRGSKFVASRSKSIKFQQVSISSNSFLFLRRVLFTRPIWLSDFSLRFSLCNTLALVSEMCLTRCVFRVPGNSKSVV